MSATPAEDPHGAEHPVEWGAPVSRARAAVVLLHGRGGAPEEMLELARNLALPDITYLAPRAAGRSWWPESFLAPLAANEPRLSSAIAAVARTVDRFVAEGIAVGRIEVLGFSQGACLALEYVARTSLPLLGVAALSGGLVGTAEADGPASPALYGHRPKRFDYPGRLDGLPVFIGCHRQDPHIPLARVEESVAVLEKLGARVTAQVYPGAGHSVVEEEIAYLRSYLNR